MNRGTRGLGNIFPNIKPSTCGLDVPWMLAVGHKHAIRGKHMTTWRKIEEMKLRNNPAVFKFDAKSKEIFNPGNMNLIKPIIWTKTFEDENKAAKTVESVDNDQVNQHVKDVSLKDDEETATSMCAEENFDFQLSINAVKFIMKINAAEFITKTLEDEKKAEMTVEYGDVDEIDQLDVKPAILSCQQVAGGGYQTQKEEVQRYIYDKHGNVGGED